jgi:hypothetical protein
MTMGITSNRLSPSLFLSTIINNMSLYHPYHNTLKLLSVRSLAVSRRGIASTATKLGGMSPPLPSFKRHPPFTSKVSMIK